MAKIALSIIIPVLNEEPVIRSVIEDIICSARSFGDSFEIIVADGGSTDGTAEVVHGLAGRDERIKYVRFQGSTNFGDSVREAVRHCTAPLLALIDGDGQAEAAGLFRMVDEIRKGADVVQGWRVVRRDPWIRCVVSTWYNVALRLFLGIGLHDCNCTLKVFKREVIGEQFLKCRTSMVSPVIVGMAMRRGMCVKELPITHGERKGPSRIFGGVKLFKQIIKIFTELFQQRRFLKSVRM